MNVAQRRYIQAPSGEIEHGYCIILSKYRVYQAVALCRSLARHIKNKESYQIFILCMDQETHCIMSKLNLTNVVLIKLSLLETNELLLIKKKRRLNEYCWTLKPIFLIYVLKSYPYIKRVTQLDADLYFFSDPASIYENQPKAAVLLSDHDFPEYNKSNELAAGKTNSGIVSFSRNQNALSCLMWWKRKCIIWCYDRVEGNKFSDQRYLDVAPKLFANISYISTPGVNIAPWNEMKYAITKRAGELYINDNKLILYHFCGLRVRNKNEYSLILEKREPIPLIYEPYLKEISKVISEIEKIDPNFNGFQIEERFKNVEKIHQINNYIEKTQESNSEETKWEENYCFATLVSNKYLYKAIAMYESLTRYCRSFQIYMLCFDQETYMILNGMQLKNVTCIPLTKIEDSELLKVKGNRSELEYCWTLKPAFLHYVMKNYTFYNYYSLIDSDLYFYDEVDRIFQEDPDKLFFLTDHNNSKEFMHLYEETGRINSGFVGCRRNENTLAAVEWWKKRCLEWCYVHCDKKAKLYADQRYLESWGDLFSSAHVIKSKAANVATWNIESYQVSQKDGIPYINDERIIFYHFSGLGIFGPKEFNLTWFRRLDSKIVEYIYVPYLKEVARIIDEIEKYHPGFIKGFTDKHANPVHYFEL